MFSDFKVVFFPSKKLHKLIINPSIFLKSGSVFITLSKILPVLNHTPDLFHIQWAKSLPFWFFFKRNIWDKNYFKFKRSHINYSPFTDKQLAKQYNILFPKVDKMHSVSENLILKAEEVWS